MIKTLVRPVGADHLRAASNAVLDQIIAESLQASVFTRLATTFTRTPAEVTIPMGYDLYPDFIDGEVISSCLVAEAG